MRHGSHERMRCNWDSMPTTLGRLVQRVGYIAWQIDVFPVEASVDGSLLGHANDRSALIKTSQRPPLHRRAVSVAGAG